MESGLAIRKRNFAAFDYLSRGQVLSLGRGVSLSLIAQISV